jgi:hypothetical protein
VSFAPIFVVTCVVNVDVSRRRHSCLRGSRGLSNSVQHRHLRALIDLPAMANRGGGFASDV